jgi:CBS domain-containing protein
MNVQSILANKDSTVVTIEPHKPIRSALTLMTSRNVGALVVVSDAHQPVGVISERDILRAMREKNEAVFSLPVSTSMARRLSEN